MAPSHKNVSKFDNPIDILLNHQLQFCGITMLITTAPSKTVTSILGKWLWYQFLNTSVLQSLCRTEKCWRKGCTLMLEELIHRLWNIVWQCYITSCICDINMPLNTYGISCWLLNHLCASAMKGFLCCVGTGVVFNVSHTGIGEDWFLYFERANYIVFLIKQKFSVSYWCRYVHQLVKRDWQT